METTLTPFEEIVKYLPFLIPVILLELTLMVIAVVDLIRREKTRWLPKWAWALIVIFIQLIGPIVYLLVGREEE
jgi:hypothetical protein